MDVMVGDRQSGKTTKMLDWMRAAPEGEHRVCVCISAQEAMRLLHYSRDQNLGLESWQFVGPEDVKRGAWSGVLMGRGGRIVLGFDNLDLWLTRQFGFEIGAVSLTAAQLHASA